MLGHTQIEIFVWQKRVVEAEVGNGDTQVGDQEVLAYFFRSSVSPTAGRFSLKADKRKQ